MHDEYDTDIFEKGDVPSLKLSRAVPAHVCAQPQALEPLCVNSQQGWQAVKQIGVFIRKIWPQ
jgi:hypothetical protein